MILPILRVLIKVLTRCSCDNLLSSGVHDVHQKVTSNASLSVRHSLNQMFSICAVLFIELVLQQFDGTSIGHALRLSFEALTPMKYDSILSLIVSVISLTFRISGSAISPGSSEYPPSIYRMSKDLDCPWYIWSSISLNWSIVSLKSLVDFYHSNPLKVFEVGRMNREKINIILSSAVHICKQT